MVEHVGSFLPCSPVSDSCLIHDVHGSAMPSFSLTLRNVQKLDRRGTPLKFAASSMLSVCASKVALALEARRAASLLVLGGGQSRS